MPSSTIWLRQPHELQNGRCTPPRPSIEFIERLSPDYQPTPQDDTYSSWNRHIAQSYNQSLQGLGLSYDSTVEEETIELEKVYPDHAEKTNFMNSTPSRDTSRLNGFTYHTRPHTRDGVPLKRKRGKAHTRSGSTIDDLASAAIATSPTFLHGGPHDLDGAVRPATSYVHSRDFTDLERPAKRIRSEKLATAEWLRKSSDSDMDLMLDAELLLGLRNPVDFKKETASPPDKLAEIQASGREDPTQRDTLLDCAAQPKQIPLPARDSEETKIVMQHSPRAPSVEPLEDEPHTTPVEEAQMSMHHAEHMEWRPAQTVAEPEHQFPPQGELISEQMFETVEGELEAALALDNAPKKPKRIKPEVQAEVCAKCQQLQSEHPAGSNSAISWIQCNPCGKWYNPACVGFKDDRETQSVDKYVCAPCEPTNGPTTFVRKSSRARAAIDYAELNQGQVKPAAEAHVHHWVQAIKAGDLPLRSESFPRMRPEFVTAEFFEDTDGMRQPLLIPAVWNPCTNLSKPHGSTVPDQSLGETDDEEAASNPDASLAQEEVIDCGQDLLDMVMPRNLTVRAVSNIYGPANTLGVIDVMKQETDFKKVWTLETWADYYEEEGEKPVRNVISLEVSENTLSRLIRRPKFVRDMDLQDLVVPENVRLKSVQFYCLMSVADSYTDFHIDFGGSAVYYHILKGKKVFFVIPPEEKNMKKYEDWNNSPDQNQIFLGNLTGDCTRVDLAEGDTMLIPSGWIHAVWTPEDSLVIGGNFLTRTDYPMQFRVVEAEQATGTPKMFRYPFFAKVMWYALIKYLEDDPIPGSILREFVNDDDYVYLRADPIWLDPNSESDLAEPGDAEYNYRHYSKSEVAGLAPLRDYLLRSARISSDLPVVPPPNKTAIKAVKASIPKGHGEPMDLIRMFAMWVAWKEGNTPVPEWVRADAASLVRLLPAIEVVNQVEPQEASESPAKMFQLDGNPSPPRLAPQRSTAEESATDDGGAIDITKLAGSGPKRVACGACRKRRIRCVHKDDTDPQSSIENSRPPTRDSNVSVEITDPRSSKAANAEIDAARMPSSQSPSLADGSLVMPLDVAQAALSTLDRNRLDIIMDGTPMNKKGRNKACESCRKSKVSPENCGSECVTVLNHHPASMYT